MFSSRTLGLLLGSFLALAALSARAENVVVSSAQVADAGLSEVFGAVDTESDLEAPGGPVKAPTPRPLGSFVAAAAIIGVVLRGAVSMLRAAGPNSAWNAQSVPVRMLILGVLTALAALCDNLTTGTPPTEALMAAVGGLFTAVSTHEFEDKLRQSRDRGAT